MAAAYSRTTIYVTDIANVETILVGTRPPATRSRLQRPATLQPYSITLAETTVRVAGRPVLRNNRPRRTTRFLTPPATLQPRSIFLAQRTIKVAGRPIIRNNRPRKTRGFYILPATLRPKASLAQEIIHVALIHTRPRPTTKFLRPGIQAGFFPPPPPPPGTLPVASFTFTISGFTYTFTDTSTPGSAGPITSWFWDFGDGGTSTLQNPTHTYAGPGTYNVTLVVNGTGGRTASTRIALLVATPSVAGLSIDAVIT